MRSSRIRPTARGASPVRGPELALSSTAPEHRVQFYDSEEFLTSAVAEFLAAGLTTGHAAVVIATDAHRRAVADRLRDDGLDIDRLTGSGQLILRDARDMLDQVMVGGMPDGARFRTVVGGVLQCAQHGDGIAPVLRAYGEMVDLLWRDGNTDGALELETCWNELAGTHEFSLLCAYAMGSFRKADDAARFQAVCRHHTHIQPTEQYLRVRADDRSREVALLEQRARSLEAELAHRAGLERRLRALLDERERLLDAERLARADADAARRDAEAATRAKSQFLAVMSHELRTPLNAIAGHVQLLDMGIYGAVTDSQRQTFQRIERSQRHLLRLINEVLNLARVESGHVDYRSEAVPLEDVLAELLPMVESQFAAKSITLALRLPATPVVLRADREKLLQILLNLASNALKFTRAGGHVTIASAADARRPDAVQIRVIDTGIGIAAEHQPGIFEPFVQVHLGPTRKADGAGLGLAISRELARGMHGDLGVESVEDEGSTFTLTLPAAVRPGDPP